tara:strand:+ start:5002 stop:5958 length:957 start_codon:yes stop_codon:yes gene_type:complete
MIYKVLIHIGYNKSATTLFQKYIFPNQKNINYLNNNGDQFLRDLRNLIHNSNLKTTELQKKSKILIKKHKSIFKKGITNLISQGYFSEIFSYKESYFFSEYKSIDTNFFSKNLKKLKLIFSKRNGFELKVLYTFREPHLMIKSYINERSFNFEIIDHNFFKDDLFDLKNLNKLNFEKKKIVKFLINHFNVYEFDKKCRRIIGNKNTIGYFVNNDKSDRIINNFFKKLDLNIKKKDFKRRVNTNPKGQLKGKNKTSFRFSSLRVNFFARLKYYYKIYLWRMTKANRSNVFYFLNENDDKLKKFYHPKLNFLKNNKLILY